MCGMECGSLPLRITCKLHQLGAKIMSDTIKGKIQNAGATAEEAAKKAGEKIKEGAESVAEKAANAAKSTGEAMKGAGKKLKEKSGG
jgi:hypothetical protein